MSMHVRFWAMLPRRFWIAGFIGHALRQHLCDDGDWACDVADECYFELSAFPPELAANVLLCASFRLANGVIQPVSVERSARSRR